MGKDCLLYGASVQGIQNFIFNTKELKDIAGASELVEDICTRLFRFVLEQVERDPDKENLRQILDKNTIVSAAGNIKYVFYDESKCREFVRIFPFFVSRYAPGITVSQAVVRVAPDDFTKAVDELENKLKIQRNRLQRNPNLGLMGIQRSRHTGLPVVAVVGNEHLDEASFKKRFVHGFDGCLCEDKAGRPIQRRATELCRKAFGRPDIKESSVAMEIGRMVKSNDWIAVIHADGNGVGQVVRKVGRDPEKFKEFSKRLNVATIAAAVDAFDKVKEMFADSDVIPIRPVVLGGDDITVICRADLALPYTEAFLKSFEEQTSVQIGGLIDGVFTKGTYRDRLTACAGIAFVKSSYPFYYAYELAEQLCSAAKADAKDNENIRNGEELPQSCIQFHKVQSSFVSDYDEIVRRELSPTSGMSLKYGPYYIHEKYGRWTLSKFHDVLGELSRKESSLTSSIRKWLTEIHDNPERAFQKRERAASFLNKEQRKLFDQIVPQKSEGKSPAYDLLSIYSVTNQETK